MSKNATTTSPTDAQTTEQTRDCDRCGRDRPANTERFTVTASDFTGATADFAIARTSFRLSRGSREVQEKVAEIIGVVR